MLSRCASQHSLAEAFHNLQISVGVEASIVLCALYSDLQSLCPVDTQVSITLDYGKEPKH